MILRPTIDEMSSCAEETGLVAMDCLVVCCCCPCLVLQITVFLLVRLPKKVVVKTKRIILRRWHRRRPSPAEVSTGCPASAAGFKLAELVDFSDGFEGAFGIGEECTTDEGWKQRCFAVDEDDVEDESVWEALMEQEGLFWFGSFWGRPEQEEEAPASGGAQMDNGYRLPVALERVCA